MTPIRTLLCALLTLAVCACASSPPVHYFSLDDGGPTVQGSQDGPRIAVTQVNLPDVIDRPQLVVRTAGHQLRLDDQYEWAEPLRRQIPRVIARHLGEALDSGRVVALPIDAQNFDADFKVMLDIQRMEVISGQKVDLDVVWRVEPRNGKIFFGRSQISEKIETTTGPGTYEAAVAAQSRALKGAAVNIAAGIASRPGDTTLDGLSPDRNAVPADPRNTRGRRNGI